MCALWRLTIFYFALSMLSLSSPQLGRFLLCRHSANLFPLRHQCSKQVIHNDMFVLGIMLLFWMTVVLQSMRCYASQPGSCSFNSMCTCSSDQHNLDARSIQDVSCASVPFYKFPSKLYVYLPCKNRLKRVNV